MKTYKVIQWRGSEVLHWFEKVSGYPERRDGNVTGTGVHSLTGRKVDFYLNPAAGPITVEAEA